MQAISSADSWLASHGLCVDIFVPTSAVINLILIAVDANIVVLRAVHELRLQALQAAFARDDKAEGHRSAFQQICDERPPELASLVTTQVEPIACVHQQGFLQETHGP